MIFTVRILLALVTSLFSREQDLYNNVRFSEIRVFHLFVLDSIHLSGKLLSQPSDGPLSIGQQWFSFVING